jgi:hypothetical protein
MLLVGIVWASLDAWALAFVVLSKLPPSSTNIADLSGYFDWGLALVGPCCFILGSILIMAGLKPHLGANLCLFASIILTGIRCYRLFNSFYPASLQVHHSYMFNVVLMVCALLIDFGSFRLYQLASRL